MKQDFECRAPELPRQTKALHISLKAGQRIYINGAVLQADRRVGLQLVNEASFLLESHVLQVDQATTPLRRLYCAAQVLLMSPGAPHDPETTWRRPLQDIRRAAIGTALEQCLADVAGELEAGHVYEALRGLRRLFPLEADLLSSAGAKATAGT